jgi:nucleoside-diphosphate-sugar epimerase
MKRLLFTGASGFLGNNILSLLKETYSVDTIGLTDADDIKINMAEAIPDLNAHYDVVLHAAGKAHTVPRTKEEEKVFYDVNYIGTIHLCDALEKAGAPKSLVFISTVAVYGCEKGELIDETYPLNGTSPYADSKKQAEKYLTGWCGERGVNLTILRPSLLAGRNAPGNLGSMVDGIRKGFYLNIAGGKAKKSVLMAEDIARLLPLVEDKSGVFNICDSYQPSFGELSVSVARQLGKRKPLNIPYWVAWCLAKTGDLLGPKAPFNSYKLQKMTEPLTFSCEKAMRELGWTPVDVLTHYTV